MTQAVFTPDSEAALAELVRGLTGPVRICGGGTRALGAGDAAPVLSTAGLSGITLYEPGALTLVAGAGTPLAEIEAALSAEGQRLAFEPPDWRGLLGSSGEPTLGGVAATNAAGPRAVTAGAARDAMLGVRFVDGTGAVIKSGGRVMKNVTGYDLVKLMAGAWGTLGVLTEVSLKVLPAPEAAACLLIEGLDDAQAIAVLAAALTSPWEVSGAAHTPRGVDGAPVTMIRIEGFAEQVRYRSGRLRDRLAQHLGAGVEIAIEDDPARVAEGWRWVRDVAAFHGRPGDVWRISTKPTDAPGLVARWRQAADVEVLYDRGGGLVWALVPEGLDLRALAPITGHATLMRAAPATRARIATFQPQPAAVARLEAGLRARFDPRGLFNPGLMTPTEAAL